MNLETTRTKLEQEHAALEHQRETTANQLRKFNAAKDSMGPDERLEREVELQNTLCRLDEQLEVIQLNLDAS